jgi:hypothetical protein
MNERMDEYVRLFPVHPEYIGTFERLIFTEKRGALVTLRDQIQAVLNAEVPSDRPGLIGYDKFWETVTSNSVLRSDLPGRTAPQGAVVPGRASAHHRPRAVGQGARHPRHQRSGSRQRHAGHGAVPSQGHRVRQRRSRLDDARLLGWEELVNLTTLAPDIVAAILDDALPNHVTLFDLAVDPPALWDDQRARLR